MRLILLIFLIGFMSAYAQDRIIDDKMIYKSIEIDTSTKAVWEKWTTEKGVKSFFAPDCSIELIPGGKYEIYFFPENEYGNKGAEGCKVLSYIPEKMFSFSWNVPPQFPELRAMGPTTWVVIQITEVDGKTVVELYHYGWREGEKWDIVYKYFDAAWSKVLIWLKESFNKSENE